MITKKTLSVFSLVSLFLLATVYFYNTQSSIVSPVINAQPEHFSSVPARSSEVTISTAITPEKPMPHHPTLLIKEVTYENYRSSLGPLAKSLRGTRIPAAFTLDSEGHLIVTSSIKSLIEYFLSATGEESLETIIGRVEEFISKQLEEPARSEALDVVAQYIGYKEALVGLENDLADNTNLSGQSSDYLTMFQYRREARMNNLSPEIYDAFFADEDKADSYTASLLEIGKNNNLTDEEKEAQYLAAEQLLPKQAQVIKQAERTRETLQENIQTARNQGANDGEIFQMRTEIYGHEAAERFAAADQKKSEWNARFEQYRQQRQQILGNQGLSDTDKTHEISSLQDALFSRTEQRRLATLDQLADKSVQL
ncbi:MAG: lipase chaperone LimK [Oleiphilaceae bacterium]|jgi:lipase chaperone LimK